MIGIIAAMNVEMESLRSFMTDTTTETISGITFVSGTLEGKQVVTAVCGIGKVFAAMCAQTMILLLPAGVHRQHGRGGHAFG